MIDLNVLFLVYDVSEAKSFQELNTLLDSIKGIPPKECVKVLIANKIDCGTKRQVAKSEGELLAKKLGVQIFEVSSVGDRQMIHNIFKEVGKREFRRGIWKDESEQRVRNSAHRRLFEMQFVLNMIFIKKG